MKQMALMRARPEEIEKRFVDVNMDLDAIKIDDLDARLDVFIRNNMPVKDAKSLNVVSPEESTGDKPEKESAQSGKGYDVAANRGDFPELLYYGNNGCEHWTEEHQKQYDAALNVIKGAKAKGKGNDGKNGGKRLQRQLLQLWETRSLREMVPGAKRRSTHGWQGQGRKRQGHRWQGSELFGKSWQSWHDAPQSYGQDLSYWGSNWQDYDVNNFERRYQTTQAGGQALYLGRGDQRGQASGDGHRELEQSTGMAADGEWSVPVKFVKSLARKRGAPGVSCNKIKSIIYIYIYIYIFLPSLG